MWGRSGVEEKPLTGKAPQTVGRPGQQQHLVEVSPRVVVTEEVQRGGAAGGEKEGAAGDDDADTDIGFVGAW